MKWALPLCKCSETNDRYLSHTVQWKPPHQLSEGCIRWQLVDVSLQSTTWIVLISFSPLHNWAHRQVYIPLSLTHGQSTANILLAAVCIKILLAATTSIFFTYVELWIEPMKKLHCSFFLVGLKVFIRFGKGKLDYLNSGEGRERKEICVRKTHDHNDSYYYITKLFLRA